MTTISCLAIDDEPYALELLHHHVEQLPYLEWCGGYQQPLEALSLLNSGAIQLLFLDINMPKINGMAFYRSLNHKPPVIFTTAYAEYAVDAFAIDAIDYLVKPILLDRFIQACNKALTKSSSPASQSIQTIETIYLKS